MTTSSTGDLDFQTAALSVNEANKGIYSQLDATLGATGATALQDMLRKAFNNPIMQEAMVAKFGTMGGELGAKAFSNIIESMKGDKEVSNKELTKMMNSLKKSLEGKDINQLQIIAKSDNAVAAESAKQTLELMVRLPQLIKGLENANESKSSNTKNFWSSLDRLKGDFDATFSYILEIFGDKKVTSALIAGATSMQELLKVYAQELANWLTPENVNSFTDGIKDIISHMPVFLAAIEEFMYGFIQWVPWMDIDDAYWEKKKKAATEKRLKATAKLNSDAGDRETVEKGISAISKRRADLESISSNLTPEMKGDYKTEYETQGNNAINRAQREYEYAMKDDIVTRKEKEIIDMYMAKANKMFDSMDRHLKIIAENAK
jgi:hypothetical protein